MLQTAFGAFCMNRASVFEWHKRFKEVRESLRYDERCGRSKQVNIPEYKGLDKGLGLLREFKKRFLGKRPALFKSGQWHFQQDNAPVHNSILVTAYLSKMDIKTVPHPSIVQTLLPVTFGYSLSSEAVVMRQLRRLNRLWQRSLTRSRKMTSMGPSRNYWNGTTIALLRRGLEFHVCTVNKSAHMKKVWKLI